MSLARSLPKLLFLYVPRSLFNIAGIVRVIRRGKKAFRKVLKNEGLPEEVADVLTEEFFIDIDWKELIFGKRDG